VDITYGSVATSAPEGFLPQRVHFPTLARLNEGTKEGGMSRTIFGSGFSVRELPLSIAAQFQTGGGHDGAFAVGRLDSVKVDGNNVEGWGWLADTEEGRKAYNGVRLGYLRGNSIDMADVTVEVDFQWEDMEAPILVNFVESRIAATTLVMTPAFASASAEIENEIMASMSVGDFTIAGTDWYVSMDEAPPVDGWKMELAASAGIVVPREAFFQKEPNEATPITIDENGWVYGHLGTWEGCHNGWVDRCVRIPRSGTNYSHYCKSTVLTDSGPVHTGPIFLLGGHEFTREAINNACADVKNAWADVRVVDGIFGPWISGIVRPGIAEEAVYAARASRISGHWLKGELYAVCSVNAEGFDVPRARFETDSDNEVEYLAASFDVTCGCDETVVVEDLGLEHLISRIRETLGDPDGSSEEGSNTSEASGQEGSAQG